MLVKDIRKSDYARVIDGTTLCELLHPKNDGVELDFSMAHAVLKAGNSSLPHKISGSIEIYFILEGKGEMHINMEKNVVQAGQAIYIPSNARQWIKNTEKDDLKFLCIVSPSWSKDNEELLP